MPTLLLDLVLTPLIPKCRTGQATHARKGGFSQGRRKKSWVGALCPLGKIELFSGIKRNSPLIRMRPLDDQNIPECPSSRLSVGSNFLRRSKNLGSSGVELRPRRGGKAKISSFPLWIDKSTADSPVTTRVRWETKTLRTRQVIWKWKRG